MGVFIVAVVVTVFYGCSASAASDLPHHEVLDENGDFILSWTFDDETIEMEAQAKTRGWLGLGLSPNGGMPGSDIVMGWVQDGQAYLSDRYADEKAQPPEDESQDWELLSGYENDTHTVLRFKRKLQTCDVRDRVINGDTFRVLWALNNEDPDSGTGPSYHGQNRGVRSSVLLRNDVNNGGDETLPSDVRSHDLVMTNTIIPSKQTTYWCKLVEMPKLQTKHHIFKVQPKITPGNEGVVHHIVLYRCNANPNRTAAPSGHPGHECYTPNMPQDWSECYQGVMITAWAVGTGDIILPSHVGYPIGDEEDSGHVLLEVHYDNPLLKEGITDNSGVTVLYTPEVRQHDAGFLLVTKSVDYSHIIPPRAADFKTVTFCNQECLDAFLDEVGEPLRVFAVMQHAHLLARKMKTTLIRDGVEMILAQDNNYDFNLQYIRMLEEEIVIQKGDTIMTECTYNTEHKNQAVYGGLGTENEMCESFLFYYPKIQMRFCESFPHPLHILSFAGVEEINYSSEVPTWPVGAIPVVKPTNMSNMTFADVVESIVWDKDKARQFSQHLLGGTYVSMCGGGTHTNVDTSLYTKECPLPKPRVPAALPEDGCTASTGSVGSRAFLLLTLICSLHSTL